MAISAIPTGLPAFVSGMLSYGAKQLAAAKAVVKNLTDVETLGATSAINTDKTGTLTMNQMMVSTIYANGSWFTVEGAGYRKTGQILSVAGTPVPDFSRLALGLVLDSDATVADDGAVVGDPTEAALVVLSAKLGVDAEETRRAYPRIAEVPFDSEYKFMATFHRVPDDPDRPGHRAGQGRPGRRAGPLHPVRWPAERLAGADRAGPRRTSRPRTRGWARRVCGSWPSRPAWSGTTTFQAMTDDPMSLTHDLAFVGMVGIIDPLRAEAKAAVAIALHAGHRRADDHRRPRGHRQGDRRDPRPRPGRDQRQRAAGDVRRGAETAAAAAARVRPGLPGGQAPAGPGDAEPGADRRDDRGRGQRCRRPEAGRHRRGDGQRQRGHQTGRPDDPDRRQLRHPGARRRAGPTGLRQDRVLRPVPDDPAAVAGHAVHRRHRLQHQPGRGADPDHGAVPAVLRHRRRGRGDHRRPGRSRT